LPPKLQIKEKTNWMTKMKNNTNNKNWSSYPIQQPKSSTCNPSPSIPILLTKKEEENRSNCKYFFILVRAKKKKKKRKWEEKYRRVAWMV
jgi:hypothetical protein